MLYGLKLGTCDKSESEKARNAELLDLLASPQVTKMLLKPKKIVLLSRPKLVLSHPYTIAIVVADVTVVDYEK